MQKSLFSFKSFLNPYVLILIFFLCRLPNARSGLADAYQFRQTQTAWGIREVERNGMNFLHLRMPVLGQPFEVPFEFPLFQNIAGLFSILSSISPSTSGRIVSLFFYCLSLVLLVYLSRELFEKNYFLFFLPLFTLTPFAIEWSNAVLIESTAVFFLLLALVFANKYLASNYIVYAIGALVFLSLAALVKITTTLPLSFFLILFLVLKSKNRILGRPVLISFLISILSLLPAVFWTLHADSIKSSNPWAEWLTSNNLRTWNFGTINSRFELSNLQAIGGRLWIIGGLIFFWAFGYLLWKSRKDLHAWIITIGAFSPILVYFNLYVVHDYYFLAVCPFIFLACAYLWENLDANQKYVNKERSVGAIVLLTVILSWALQIPQRNYLDILRMPRNAIPELSQTISTYTKTADKILVVGCDWDPTVLYHADRYGIASPGKFGGVQSVLDFLATTSNHMDYSYLATCPGTVMPDALSGAKVELIAANFYKLRFTNN
jgi:hypothetical protein